MQGIIYNASQPSACIIAHSLTLMNADKKDYVIPLIPARPSGSL